MLIRTKRYVKKRSYKICDEALFLEKIRNISWWDIYQTTDASEAAQLFTNKITCILDQMAPVKTFQTSSKYCLWLTEETKNMITERNKAQQIVSESKTDENFKNYKNLRNKVTNSLKKDKINWQKQKLKSCNNDPGKLWKNILVFIWFSF